MKLENLACIVTGGGRGIGRAISLALAKEGAHVAIVALKDLRSAEETAQKVVQLDRKSVAIQADITDQHAVTRMVQVVLEKFGRIDLLVSNAGAISKAPLEQVSVEDWDRVVAVNLKGVFLCGVAVAREMMKRGKGNIINIIAASAHRFYGGGGAYGPSKSGVLSLTKQMAMEWANYTIRVNGVSPGPIMTPEMEARIKEEDARGRISRIPLGRAGRPEEIAAAVVFLASEQSSYMTGQVLIVDGGGVETWYLYP